MSDIQDWQSWVQAKRLRHVAVIMDGNRRWAKQRHLPSLMGHKQGVDTLKQLVRYCGDLGLEALTVYAFSTENWNRSAQEVHYLMKLFLEALAAELDALHAQRVRLRFIGDLTVLPTELQALIESAHVQTAHNTGLQFQIAANYGGRHELVQAMQQLGRAIQAGQLQPEAITEQLVEEKLYTHGIPAPDLLIRTGGEHRVSNYLLWQCAYAEFYVTDVPWPDFDIAAFQAALAEYARRERRYGQ